MEAQSSRREWRLCRGSAAGDRQRGRTESKQAERGPRCEASRAGRDKQFTECFLFEPLTRQSKSAGKKYHSKEKDLDEPLSHAEISRAQPKYSTPLSRVLLKALEGFCLTPLRLSPNADALFDSLILLLIGSLSALSVHWIESNQFVIDFW